MKVTKLINSNALRGWTTGEGLAEGVASLIYKARAEDIEPQSITFRQDEDYEQTGLYEIILWGIG